MKKEGVQKESRTSKCSERREEGERSETEKLETGRFKKENFLPVHSRSEIDRYVGK